MRACSRDRHGVCVPFAVTLWLLMVAAHVIGAVRKIQPPVETYEIGFWGGLAILTLLFWPNAV